MIETYLLEHLVAFKRHRTLSEAADALHLTQPTLTRSMGKLEDEFGVSLFIREKKRLYLNENGMLAAQYAEEILSRQGDMLSQVRALDRRSRTVTVGSCAPGPLMELMPLLSSTFAHMTVSTEVADIDSLTRGLAGGTYQMIILEHPVEACTTPDGVAKECFCMKCSSEQLCASLPYDHRLAHETSISFSDMDGESFLMVSEVGIWGDLVRCKMPSSQFLLQEGTDSLRQVVASSTLASFVTDITLRVLGSRIGRSVVPFSDEEASMDFYCICLASEKAKYKTWYESISRRI